MKKYYQFKILDNLNFHYDYNNLNFLLHKYDDVDVNSLFIFSVIKILTDYVEPDLKKFKPANGYEFIDKSDYNNPLGIYHSHLCKYKSKLLVLIWYFRENEQNYYDIIFDILPHPDDDYEQVIQNIKSDNLNLNPNTWKNFGEKFKIKNWKEFLFEYIKIK